MPKIFLKSLLTHHRPRAERRDETTLLQPLWKWLIFTAGASLLPEATCGQLPSEPVGAAHLITSLGLLPWNGKQALPQA